MLPKRIKRHPVATGLIAFASFLVVGFPVWLATIWPLFSGETLVDVMRRNGWGLAVVGPLYGWFSVALGFICFLLLLVIVWSSAGSVSSSATGSQVSAGGRRTARRIASSAVAADVPIPFPNRDGVPQAIGQRGESVSAVTDSHKYADAAKLSIAWYDGAEPVVEVANESDGVIECSGIGQILKAEPVHRRRDSFPVSWRNHYKSDKWIKLEPKEKRKVLIAYVQTNQFGSQQYAVIPQHGGSAESWKLERFHYADMFIEFSTRPPLAKPVKDWFRLTWNGREEIFRLGKPLENDREPTKP